MRKARALVGTGLLAAGMAAVPAAPNQGHHDNAPAAVGAPARSEAGSPRLELSFPGLEGHVATARRAGEIAAASVAGVTMADAYVRDLAANTPPDARVGEALPPVVAPDADVYDVVPFGISPHPVSDGATEHYLPVPGDDQDTDPYDNPNTEGSEQAAIDRATSGKKPEAIPGDDGVMITADNKTPRVAEGPTPPLPEDVSDAAPVRYIEDLGSLDDPLHPGNRFAIIGTPPSYPAPAPAPENIPGGPDATDGRTGSNN